MQSSPLSRVVVCLLALSTVLVVVLQTADPAPAEPEVRDSISSHNFEDSDREEGPFVLVVDPLPPPLPPVPTPATVPPYELVIPVAGVTPGELQDTFDAARGSDRRHLAIDILAPTGTPVLAAAAGEILRMHRSPRGGITLYLLDRDHDFIYYYAHLDGYADSLEVGMTVSAGEVIGYVGHTGNAHEDVPHLHLAIWKHRPGGSGWGGRPVNPYQALTQ